MIKPETPLLKGVALLRSLVTRRCRTPGFMWDYGFMLFKRQVKTHRLFAFPHLSAFMFHVPAVICRHLLPVWSVYAWLQIERIVVSPFSPWWSSFSEAEHDELWDSHVSSLVFLVFSSSPANVSFPPSCSQIKVCVGPSLPQQLLLLQRPSLKCHTSLIPLCIWVLPLCSPQPPEDQAASLVVRIDFCGQFSYVWKGHTACTVGRVWALYS